MSIDIKPLNHKTLQKGIDTAVAVFEESEREGIALEFNASLGIEPDDTTVLAERNISEAQYYLGSENGAPAGTVGYYYIAGHEEDAWLGWFGVKPEFYGKGYGKILLAHAFNQAAQDGAKNMRLWTTAEPKHADACKLYERMGFKKEVYKPNAKDAGNMVLVFSKAIDPNAKHDVSWADNGYEIDCEPYEIPHMNKLYGLTPDPREGQVAPTAVTQQSKSRDHKGLHI